MRSARADRGAEPAPSVLEVVSKTLLLMRHGKSSRKAGCPDLERPLTGRGRRDSAATGALVSEVFGVPDVWLSSTAARALQTATLAAEACGHHGIVQAVTALYSTAAGDLVEALLDVDDGAGSAIVIAHNPGLEELWAQLTGRAEHLPTAAVAAIELEIGGWTSLQSGARGRAIGLWCPRRLRAPGDGQAPLPAGGRRP